MKTNSGITINNKILKDIESSNIPLNIILGATNTSPPGINTRSQTYGDESEGFSEKGESSRAFDECLKNSMKKNNTRYGLYEDSNGSIVKSMYFNEQATDLNSESFREIGSSYDSDKGKVIPKFKLPINTLGVKVKNSSSYNTVTNFQREIENIKEKNDFRINDKCENSRRSIERVFDITNTKYETDFCASKQNNTEDEDLIEEINKENTELALNIIREINTGKKQESEDDKFTEIVVEEKNKPNKFYSEYEINKLNTKLEKAIFEDVFRVNKDDAHNSFETKLDKYIEECSYCRDNEESTESGIIINNIIGKYVPLSTIVRGETAPKECENKSAKIEEVFEETSLEEGNRKSHSSFEGDTNISELCVGQRKDGNPYSVFKSDEEFSELFNRLWVEAGKEMEKECGDQSNHESDELLLNPVPFRSDLLELNNKRKIKTTVPPIKGITKKNENTVINPVGLLRSLKYTDGCYEGDKVNKETEIQANMDDIVSGGICVEEMSTRAPSSAFLNNNKPTARKLGRTLSLSYDNNSQERTPHREIDYPTFIFSKRKDQAELNTNKNHGFERNGTKSPRKCDNDRTGSFEDFLVIKDHHGACEDEDSHFKKKGDFVVEINSSEINEKSFDEKDESASPIEAIELEGKPDKNYHKIEFDVGRYDYGFSIDDDHERHIADRTDESKGEEDLEKNCKIIEKAESSTQDKKEETGILSSISLNEEYRKAFSEFDLREIMSQLPLFENLNAEESNRHTLVCTWKESMGYFRKNMPFSVWTSSKGVRLLATRVTILLISSILSNVVLSFVTMRVISYNTNNTKKRYCIALILANPLLNYISLYIVGGSVILGHILDRIAKFSRLLLQDYASYLNSIKIREKREDAMLDVFNQAMNLYIESVVEGNGTEERVGRILYVFRLLGLGQTALSIVLVLAFSLGYFVSTKNNSLERGVLVALLLSVSQGLIYWSMIVSYLYFRETKRLAFARSPFSGRKSKNKDHLLSSSQVEAYIQDYIQRKQTQFLTFTCCVTELVLFNNFGCVDACDSKISAVYRNSLNISVSEMEQYSKRCARKDKGYCKVGNSRILCRIRFPAIQDYTYIWPFAYIHYDSKEKSVLVSNSSLYMESENALIQKMPTKVVSIEHIQYTPLPWMHIYGGHDPSSKRNAGSCNQSDLFNESVYESIGYLFEDQFLANVGFARQKKRKQGGFYCDHDLRWKIDDIVNKHAHLRFNDSDQNEESGTYCDSFEDFRGGSHSRHEYSQNVYVLHCNFPYELCLEHKSKSRDDGNSGELFKFQIMCLSFSDLLNVYRIFS